MLKLLNPGRTKLSSMEAPDPPDAVVPFDAGAYNSRPGPVFGVGDGVFQTASLGKYNHDNTSSPPDELSNPSLSSNTQHFEDTLSGTCFQMLPHSTSSSFSALRQPPGCKPASRKEAPNSLVTVEPFPPAINSHPGPVYESGGGVFQIPNAGKYSSAMNISLPQTSSIFDTRILLNPRRTTRGMMECDIASSHQSRLSPAVGNGERDLHPPLITDMTHSATTYGLRVYYQNARGLKTKLDDVYLAVLDGDYDVYVFTETWLDGRINSVQLFGDSFSVYRLDRNSANSVRTRGGGVLVAVSNAFPSCLIAEERFTSIEAVWVKVSLSGRKIFIGAVYIPPERRHDCSTMQLHLEAVEFASSLADSKDDLLWLGDFNQPGLIWSPSGQGYAFPDPVASTFTPAGRLLVDGTAFHGLSQFSLIPNFQSHFLDLVFVSNSLLHSSFVVEAADIVVPLDNFHPALDIFIANGSQLYYDEFSNADRLNFRKTDYHLLRRSLSRIDWNVLNDVDIDTAVARYNCLLRDCVSASVPMCQPPRKPPWTNATLRNLKRARARALRAFSNRRGAFTKRNFASASNEYRSYNKFLYKRYVNRTEQNLRRNPKGFWTFVNTKRKETGLPSKLFLDNDTASSAEDKCTLFARHFSSVFSNDTPSPAEIENAVRDVPNDVVDMDVFAVDYQMVLSAIRSTKSSFSPGPSIIPSAVLKKCSDILVTPLTKLFNLSLHQQKFPVLWKRSTMFPVFKKGNKSNVENYRGITSLGVESKVFESLINERLFASCKQYISTCQHGFFPGRSVETNLVSFTSFCLEKISKKLQVDAIYTDLKAAFDKVNHNILLAKLEKIGCSARLCNWLRSYLVQREVTVCVGDSTSYCFSNSSGVPQGSTLGPLLFSLFVNDITFILQRGGKLFFADDLKIYHVIHDEADCLELQNLLEIFKDWCERNMMVLSVSKCCVISFHRTRSVISFDYNVAGTPLQRVDHVKDLGVVLDERLTYTRHYSATLDKANRQLGFMFKISNEFRDPLCFKTLYCSLVRSLLEFASVVWNPYQGVWSARFEAVQRRFVRYALRFLPWRDPLNLPPYADRCRLLGLDTLTERRNASLAVFVAKVLLAEYDVPELLAKINLYAPTRTLRPRTLLHEELHSTYYAANSSLNAMIHRFNEVSDQFDFCMTSSRFRRHLLSNNFNA